jgi:hypothetical protein
VASWGTNIGNMAWEGPGTPGELYWRFKQVLQKQGNNHLLVAAAGNQGRPLLPQPQCGPFFFMPAQLQLDNMLVVGASGEQIAAAAGVQR